MGYCLNPDCSRPQNPPNVKQCQACGSSLVLHDRYLTVKKLGKGGFGATFLAVDVSLPGNPCCVIKQLRPSNSEPGLLEMARELFAREARTLGKVGNHPQVPRLLDYFEVQEQFYLIQEFVQGLNLHQEIKQQGVFDEEKVKYFLSEILPVLDYIHANRVIHRDIKPANIIRRDIDNKLVLIDFGAVKNEINTLAAANTSSRTALTAFAIGTLGFAPPEQLAMRPVYASDIYAVGVTAIYLLTGKSPKDLGIDPATGELQWHEYVSLSPTLTQVLEKMLELSVRNRYKSGKEILEVLQFEEDSQDLSGGLMTQPSGSLPNHNMSWNRDSLSSGMLNSGMLNSGMLSQKPSTNRRVSAQAEAIRDLQDRRRQRSEQSLDSTDVTQKGESLEANKPSLQKGKPGQSSQKIVKLPAELTEELVLEAYSYGWVDFCQRSLKRFNLKKANLAGSKFHQSQLVEVNFQGANLSKADFGRANLFKAILRDANISEAYLGYANLEDADLRGADLSFAYLNYANLKGANLCGANLSGARISDTQLAQAKTNWRTVLPQ
ncbi:MAG: serine/threonine protein kinase [Gloeocapsa sp. DLM2.Bin57]|nr:MAG: serine/threonine protein kinase [Gloeocapsa sp. DLM2.Bin57]